MPVLKSFPAAIAPGSWDMESPELYDNRFSGDIPNPGMFGHIFIVYSQACARKHVDSRAASSWFGL